MAKMNMKKTVVEDLKSSEGFEKTSETLKAIGKEAEAEKVEREEKKADSKKTQVATVVFSLDDYIEYKKIFGGEGYSFAQGTRMILDFMRREMKDGTLELTQSGFRKNSLANRYR